jgi:hypothetical protein
MKFKRFIQMLLQIKIVCFLARRLNNSPAFETMLASEEVLRRDWDTPEEDAAWAHL